MRTKITHCFLTLFGLLITALVVWATMAYATVHLGVASSYWLVPIFGGLGGMVGGLLRSENKLELCSFEGATKVNLGTVGQVVSGLGGASALVFLFGGTLLKFDPKQAESLVLIASISFVAGAFGKNIVEAAGQKLSPQQKKEVQGLVGPPAALIYTSAARDAIRRGENEEALRILETAFDLDRNCVGAYVEQGRAFKRLGRYNEALGAVEKALQLNPDKAEALYNRACYKSLLGQPASSVAPDLKKAFNSLPSLKKSVFSTEEKDLDADLASVRDAKEIQELR